MLKGRASATRESFVLRRDVGGGRGRGRGSRDSWKERKNRKEERNVGRRERIGAGKKMGSERMEMRRRGRREGEVKGKGGKERK